MIGQEADALIAHPHLVGFFLPRQFGRTEACTDLDALHRVDAHQRRGQLGIELGIDRRAQSRRHAFGAHLDHGADRGSLLSDIVEVALEERGLVLVRAEERIARDLVPVPFVAIDLVRTHLHQRTAHGDVGQYLAGDGAGGDAGRGLAAKMPRPREIRKPGCRFADPDYTARMYLSYPTY